VVRFVSSNPKKVFRGDELVGYSERESGALFTFELSLRCPHLRRSDPARPPLPTDSSLPFQCAAGSHTSILILQQKDSSPSFAMPTAGEKVPGDPRFAETRTSVQHCSDAAENQQNDNDEKNQA
jgi:hypothetical protein